MHLENQSALQTVSQQAVADADHGNFDDIRGGALNRGIHRDTLTERAHIEVLALQLGQRAAAAKQRGNIALLPAGLLDVLHIFLHARIGVKVGFDKLARLFARHADILREREIRDAVHDAEVDRLARGAHLRRDLLKRHMVDLGSRCGVNILPVLEGFDHVLVLRDMREHAQFDLRIIRVNQDVIFVRCDKHAAQFAAKLGADRNILQVRFGRGQASGGGHGLLKMRVNASVRRTDDLEKSLNVGAFQLGQLAVLEDARHDRVVLRDTLKHLNVGGIACFCLFRSLQAEFLEQHLAQLLGTVDVELAVRVMINLLGQVADTHIQLVTEGTQLIRLDRTARRFHLSQHAQERQLDFVVQLSHAELLNPVSRLGVNGAQRTDMLRHGLLSVLLTAEQRNRRRIVQIQLRQLGIAVRKRKPRQVVAGLGRVEQIRRDGGVEHDALRVHTALQQCPHGGLRIVQHERQRAVEQAAQNVVPRVTERLREQDVRRVAVQQANCT